MGRLFAGTQWDQPPKCDRCGALLTTCECPAPPPVRLSPSEQSAQVKLEKRQKGKVVTVVVGLSVEGNDLPALLSELKSVCGAGGSLKDGQLEIQGDHQQRIADTLSGKGYRVKRTSR